MVVKEESKDTCIVIAWHLTNHLYYVVLFIIQSMGILEEILRKSLAFLTLVAACIYSAINVRLVPM